VNERLAKHYGIKNIYGSQFRRVVLGPDMDVRKGLTGKGAPARYYGKTRPDIAGDSRQNGS
jgi:hypothetical protein